MANFLLEVGTEELPADFARLVLPQLEQMVATDLAEKNLSYDLITTTSTPRRIVLFLKGIELKANDSEKVFKGPPSLNAFIDGSPTNAAIGFAKRFDLDASDLEIRETPKGQFVFAKVLEKGDSAHNILRSAIPRWISAMQGRRFMRWGNGQIRFSRPIRWLVALLDNSILHLSVGDQDVEVNSGNISRGHRLHKSSLEIHSAEEYFPLLKQVGVEVDRNARSLCISQLINEAASKFNAKADLPKPLLDELTDLVESPSLIHGEFDKSYLDLPPEVLSTVMRSHQRYIPLVSGKSSFDQLALDSKNYLLPVFLCISNGLSKSKEIIVKGNERVLKARLSDAEFFVKSDLSISSFTRREQLGKVVFCEGLGSLLNRVERIEWLAKLIYGDLDFKDVQEVDVVRAAKLCKHDLVSQIVGEFPELQGVMGGKYLLVEGESRNIALAVLEHYFPRGAGDQLPESKIGIILALAERLELLISIFAKGQRPTGSSDPYALRRAANGIVQIICVKNIEVNLYKILSLAICYWEETFPDLDINQDKILEELSEFLRFRLINFLEESGIDSDLVLATAGESFTVDRILTDPVDTKLRANLLLSMRRLGKLIAIQAVVTRASKLAESSEIPNNILDTKTHIAPDLFEKSSEFKMLEVLDKLFPIVNEKNNKRYSLLSEALASSASVLAEFFDGDESVMVMTEDLKVRANRLNLLAIFCNQSRVLADFDRIS